MDIRDCITDSGALDAASVAVSNGKLIVLPTDTVYGIGADAFNPAAVNNLLEAKGRGRQMPPPVLVGTKETAEALADGLPQAARDLIEKFWPGALTLIVLAQPSLAWDLGETEGTVALRMPDSEVALNLLKRTGPLAVSSANIHSQPAATTIEEASSMLGESVGLYLDGGKAGGGVASTIVDVTSQPARILRQGAISREDIAAVVELEENVEP
ncbi:L-threonylcarbamoyladenylate synthase [Flaviflexus massiliensis]|uniref:L-threonylcarbamoyladenylate synthase n=1 Tax=Flaviflexus massiliensis TaxID=1522309 RepID=UPI0006D5A329|nr:L-threonylcarbamoyladenylate synthase [Flaviflexus massiliensis]